MTPSATCITKIQEFEGFRSKVYADAGGRPTVGYGHLLAHGEMLWCVDGISAQTALHLLKMDLDRIAAKVTELTQGMGLRQCEFDALCCLAFNIGPEALEKSTLLRDLRAGDIQGATASWVQWDHCAGKVMDGLRKRREAEVAMFCGQAATAA